MWMGVEGVWLGWAGVAWSTAVIMGHLIVQAISRNLCYYHCHRYLSLSLPPPPPPSSPSIVIVTSQPLLIPHRPTHFLPTHTLSPFRHAIFTGDGLLLRPARIRVSCVIFLRTGPALWEREDLFLLRFIRHFYLFPLGRLSILGFSFRLETVYY